MRICARTEGFSPRRVGDAATVAARKRLAEQARRRCRPPRRAAERVKGASRMFFSRKLRRSSMTIMVLHSLENSAHQLARRPDSSCPSGGSGNCPSSPRSASTCSRYGPAHAGDDEAERGRIRRHLDLRSRIGNDPVDSQFPCRLHRRREALGDLQFLLPGSRREQDLVQIDLARSPARTSALVLSCGNWFGWQSTVPPPSAWAVVTM